MAKLLSDDELAEIKSTLSTVTGVLSSFKKFIVRAKDDDKDRLLTTDMFIDIAVDDLIEHIGEVIDGLS